MKKILLFFFLSLFAPSIFAISLDKTSEVKNYINILMEDSFVMWYSQDISLDQKVAKARKSIARNFDLKLMGEYALGMHIRTISDSELKQYISAYSQYMINIQSQTIKHYTGQKILISSVQEIVQGDYIVKTSVVGKSNKAIFMDFYVSSMEENGKNIYKVYDIITENISLAETQRAEYSSMIDQEGIKYLIKMLTGKASSNYN